ncbi:MAG: phosphotransferase [Deltaproteobacteria bacterium]|nr:phosphotransferase [Deltaproteobacteria bacterium]
MPGGASTRKFFRVTLENRSAVAMFVPDLAHSDEIEKKGKPRRWPYLEVRDLLHDRGVRVPALIADGTDRGWTVVEDLGDQTMAERLLEQPQDKRTIYQAAVTDLARAQLALEKLPEDSVVRTRAFDYDLLRWEIEHFREWGLDALDRPLAEGAKDAFDAVADRIARRVADLPRGFVHRDYQSRNLMVLSGPGEPVELAWVDFQDALMGPMVYDLVALLNDSYQQFDRAFVEERLEEFGQARGLSEPDRKALVGQFDLVTVQRKLKDAGRFVFIDRVKKDPSYLKFVEPTLHKVRTSIDRLPGDPDLRELRKILAYVLD